MASVFKVSPCQTLHDATQRVHVDPSVFEDKKLYLGQVVKVSTRQSEYLCSIWPGREKTCCFDKLVEKEAVEKQKLETGCCVIEAVETGELTKITVEVILTQDAISQFGSNTQNELLLDCVRNLLHRKYVACDFVLHSHMLAVSKLTGVHELLVHKIVPDDAIGSISKFTEIEMVNIMSEARYKQKQQFQTLKLGGVAEKLQDMKLHVRMPQITGFRCSISKDYTKFNTLVRGPPGNGKTEFVKIVARECNAFCYIVTPANCTGSRFGEMNDKMRKIFEEVKTHATEGLCIVLFKDVDVFCPKEKQKQQDSQEQTYGKFTHLFDKLCELENVVIFGTTNKSSPLEPALRQEHRFGKEIFLGIPDEEQRAAVLSCLASNMPLDPSCNLRSIAASTPGYSGSDLKLLVHTAIKHAGKQGRSMLTNPDLQSALQCVQPSAVKGSPYALQFKKVAWSDIGGMENVKRQIYEVVELPVLHPEVFPRMGIPCPRGVLLYGPPGCGKTTLVRAAASSAHVTFLAVSCAELYSAYVGDSEKKVAEIFHQARAASPCILFLDEVDVLVGQRGGREGEGVQDNVLLALLSEMDGFGTRSDVAGKLKQSDRVIVVMATNRPDVLDSALTRRGRVDRAIYIPPPDEKGRESILNIYLSRMPTGDVNVPKLVNMTSRFSGADLENLCREAALHALTADGLDVSSVTQEHFEQVLKTLSASISAEDLRHYSSVQIGQKRSKVQYPVQKCA